MNKWIIVMNDGKEITIQGQSNIVDGIIRGCCEAGEKADGNKYYPHDVVKAHAQRIG